jgi:hypothetical protein
VYVDVQKDPKDPNSKKYTYRLQDEQGVPRPMVVIFEHLVSTGDRASFSEFRTTTDEHGEFQDDIGPVVPLQSGHFVITQTFSEGSGSAPVLSTVSSHRILVTNGSVIIKFGVLHA